MKSLPNYHIHELIYDGQRSTIYRGSKIDDQKTVVIKFLKGEPPTLKDLRRFHREFQIGKFFLGIEEIIQYSSIFEFELGAALILENFVGIPLERQIPTKGMNLDQFFILSLQIVRGLQKIHEKKIIHKNLHSSNILIDPTQQKVKIIDFGIASELEQERTLPFVPYQIEGDPAYFSPEQTGKGSQDLDYRTDFYSLGIIFYKMLTGKHPFEAQDSFEMIYSQLTKSPYPPEQVQARVPEMLSMLVIKLLNKNVEYRYQSCLGLEKDLNICLQEFQAAGKVSYFELGTYDFSEKFHVPTHLYGKEREAKLLQEAFSRSSQSRAEVFLIQGESGAGKRALIQEIRKLVAQKQGYFLTGKFDRFNQTPYIGLKKGFQGIIFQILGEGEKRIQWWKDSLLLALENHGKIIIDFIPELELLIGEQPEVAELGILENQNRFHLVFQDFINAFAHLEHPLVFVLENLQWADPDSLKLLEFLFSNEEIFYFLFIGCFQYPQENSKFPFFENFQKRFPSLFHQVSLPPMRLPYIKRLLRETLLRDNQEIKNLAELIRKKTHGNSFLIREFLQSLYQEGLFQVSEKQMCWQWDLSKIQEFAEKKNASTLVLDRIHQLSEETQEILKIASCHGSQFDLNSISLILGKEPKELEKQLREAEQLELLRSIEEKSNILYYFFHDQILYTFCNLISKEEKNKLHLEIGMTSWEQISPQKFQEKIFEIVSHLNLGKKWIQSSQEKIELARLNLQAAQKARLVAAHQSAFIFLQEGIHLLEEKDWVRNFSLVLDFHQKNAQVAFLCSQFTEMEKSIELSLKKAKNWTDQVCIRELQIQAHISQGRAFDASKLTREMLKKLGVALPQKAYLYHYLMMLLRVKVAMLGKNLEELQNSPKKMDFKSETAIRLLHLTMASTGTTQPEILPIMMMSQVLLLLKNPNPAMAPSIYIQYSYLLCVISENFEEGYRFGQLALDMADQKGIIQCERYPINRVHVTFGGAIRFHREHLRETLHDFTKGYRNDLANGDLIYASYSVYMYNYHNFYIGTELNKVIRRMEKSGATIQRLNPLAFNWDSILRQTVWNLIYETETPRSLEGKYYSETKMLPKHKREEDRLAILSLCFCKLYLSFLFGNYVQAQQDALEMRSKLNTVKGVFCGYLFYFYDSLICLTLFWEKEEPGKNLAIKQVHKNQKKLHKVVFSAPMNFQHKYDLVQAELARVSGDFAQAIQLYQKAQKGAEKEGFLQEEALCCELYAKFWIERQEMKSAQTYFNEALELYKRWGAESKVNQLERQYPDLSCCSNLTFSNHEMTTKTAYSIPNFDFGLILQSSQAMSGEIHLEQLLSKLISMMIDNMGAQKGVFVLKNPTTDLLEIQAQGEMNQEIITQPVPLLGDESLPKSIIDYVVRHQKLLVLRDASQEEIFQNDRYISQKQVLSLLCGPILHQGKMIGLLYLESNLMVGAFTQESLEVFNVLSGQAAISIVNALLYRTMEQKIEQRTLLLAEKTQNIQSMLQSIKQGIFTILKDNVIHSEYSSFLEEILETPNIAGSNVMETLFNKTNLPLQQAEQLELVLRSLIGKKLREYHKQSDILVSDITKMTQDGRQKMLELDWSPILNSSRKIEKIMVTVRDVTRLKKLQAQAERQEKELVEIAHRAGMADIARGILHNVGNALNSVNVSYELLEKTVKNSGVSSLQMANKLLQENMDDLSYFFTEHKKGKLLPQYYLELGKKIHGKTVSSLEELQTMKKGLYLINEILETQHDYAISEKREMEFELGKVVDEVLTIMEKTMKKHQIYIVRQYTKTPYVKTVKIKLVQVLMNLFKNAKEAMLDSTPAQRKLFIHIFPIGSMVAVQIRDCGVGIPSHQMPSIFKQGFTTKKKGHGYGLHTCASWIEDMGGKIEVESPGEGSGSTFTIQLPQFNF